MKSKVLIADDHPIFRTGVRDILMRSDEIELVAEASNGMDAYRLIVAHRPDVAILDLEMPVLSGLDVCKKVLAEKNQTAFIVLTMHNEKQYFLDAIKHGVLGYLLKDTADVDLIACIQAVRQQKLFVSPALASFLDEHQQEAEGDETMQQVNKLLTATEKLILKLIAEGKTSNQIAELLFVSANTVDNHRGNITRKLNLSGKNALLQFTLQQKGKI